MIGRIAKEGKRQQFSRTPTSKKNTLQIDYYTFSLTAQCVKSWKKTKTEQRIKVKFGGGSNSSLDIFDVPLKKNTVEFLWHDPSIYSGTYSGALYYNNNLP